MTAYYDNQPSIFQKISPIMTKYRWDIQEVEMQHGEEVIKSWKCEEVLMYAPISKKKVVSTVIGEKWDLNHEQKLVNEYNSAVNKIITGEDATKAKEAYSSFLTERKTLKAKVEEDCDDFGVL